MKLRHVSILLDDGRRSDAVGIDIDLHFRRRARFQAERGGVGAAMGIRRWYACSGREAYGRGKNDIESPITDTLSTPPSRRELILDAAAHAFATDGYRLSSLRRIAKAADCSLTLLVHHFGNKAGLVTAVVTQQQAFCERRLVSLRSQLAVGGLDFEQLASAWANHEFEQHATREGKLYLNVVLRLQADREVDDDIRRTLNLSEPVVTKGLERAWPSLDHASRKGLWLMASAGLYAAVTSLDQVQEISTAEVIAAVRQRAVAYLVSGLYGYCAGAMA